MTTQKTYTLQETTALHNKEMERYTMSPYADITLTRKERLEKYGVHILGRLRVLVAGWTIGDMTEHILHFFRNPGHKQLFELFLSGDPGPEKAANAAFSMATTTHTVIAMRRGGSVTDILAYLFMYLAIEVSSNEVSANDTQIHLWGVLRYLIRDNATHWKGS